MASPAQIAANQANSQKSTGPRTSEGRAAVRFNAFRHGADARSLVIPGEDPEGLRALQNYYRDRFQPRDPETHTLVDCVIHATWTLKRLYRAETAVLNKLMLYTDNDLGQAYLNDANGPNLLSKIARQMITLDRTRQRALAALYKLYPDEPESTNVLTPKLALFRKLTAKANLTLQTPAQQRNRDAELALRL